MVRQTALEFLMGSAVLLAPPPKTQKQDMAALLSLVECCGLLCAEGNANAAIRLEQSGNDLIKTHHIDILCAYPISAFHGNELQEAFRSICAAHSAVHFQ